MIKHVHVNECDSTQDLLKEQLNNQTSSEQFLVSCENQLRGRGRGENKWTGMPGTICLSLNIKPHREISFTALELSVLVARFFEAKGKSLKLKWPNDLWDTNLRKCGGILVQGTQSHLLAGIGLNLFTHDSDFGSVYGSPFEIDKKIWSHDLATFILDNRYEDTDELRAHWIERCGHLHERVRVTEGSETHEGKFLGIGVHGEALVDTLRLYNGSLRLIR